MKGLIAAGHPETAEAARIILDQGGNAFDAVLGGVLAACVAEPVLASLGGGGFLMAQPRNDKARLYDFFAHTPAVRGPMADLDFRPVHADFGEVTQEFHIGLGTCAVPGLVSGWFEVHRDLGHLPLSDISAPAIHLAREGLSTNDFQAHVFDVVRPIYTDTAGSRQLFASPQQSNALLRSGDHYRLPELADLLESLVIEGSALFYRGEIAKQIEDLGATDGGSLTRNDLENYRLHRRQPLTMVRNGVQIHLNPPPSSGGLLIHLGLDVLWQLAETPDHSPAAVQMAEVLAAVDQARLEAWENSVEAPLAGLLAADTVIRYRNLARKHLQAHKGTTHLSIIDTDGNVASLTVSNGEGCGRILPGCGFMLNNMLGEADLNPSGFHHWAPDTRLSSMMCPTILQHRSGGLTATGSGGSNRIRSALTQVIFQLSDEDLPLEDAVRQPRLHVEDELLSIEGGFDEQTVAALCRRFERYQVWPDRNLFFGGAHSVRFNPGSGCAEGAGDSRRSGVSLVL